MNVLLHQIFCAHRFAYSMFVAKAIASIQPHLEQRFCNISLMDECKMDYVLH